MHTSSCIEWQFCLIKKLKDTTIKCIMAARSEDVNARCSNPRWYYPEIVDVGTRYSGCIGSPKLLHLDVAVHGSSACWQREKNDNPTKISLKVQLLPEVCGLVWKMFGGKASHQPCTEWSPQRKTWWHPQSRSMWHPQNVAIVPSLGACMWYLPAGSYQQAKWQETVF